MRDREPREKLVDIPSVKQVAALYTDRALRPKTEVFLKRDPIAGYSGHEAPGAESLNNVIFAGETAIGITQIQGTSESDRGAIRVVILPVGDKAGRVGELQSSATIDRVDISALNQPRMNGVVQRWEDIHIGRSKVEHFTGNPDNMMSRNHLTVRVTSEGLVSVIDQQSTNGTRIVQARDFVSSEDFGGLPQDSKETVASFINQFDKKDYMWREAYSGNMVVDPERH